MNDKTDMQGSSNTSTGNYYYLPSNVTPLARSLAVQKEESTLAGRYKTPTSLRGKLASKLLKDTLGSIPIEEREPQYVLSNPLYPVAANWQRLIDYLYREGILELPYATFDQIFPDDPKIYALRLWAASMQTDGVANLANGGYSRGVSFDFEEAISKVLGEQLERYALGLYRDKDLFRASITSLANRKEHFLDPRLVDKFSPEQKKKFPSRNFDNESIFRFVQGVSLTQKKKAFIPAQMVFVNFRFAENEPIICLPGTNGAGGMFTHEEAVLSGLYELIQRDAFLLHWLSGTAPNSIDIGSISDPQIGKCAEVLRRYRLDVKILDTTSDIGIPSFAAILIDDSGIGPAITVGGGCGLDPEKAILRSITEAIGVRSWLRRTRQKQLHRPLPSLKDTQPFSENLGAEKRLLLWYERSSIERIQPFLSGKSVTISPKTSKTPQSPNEELEYVLSKFINRGPGYEVFAYSAKNAVLSKLGYCSVKVCVPALLPLYLQETYAPLGAQRLTHGVKNTLPHPFP